MNGAAHVTFAGAGIVLPAREPCERELLVEHVAERVRRQGVVHAAIGGRTWNVRRIDDTVAVACRRCRRAENGTCYATTRGACERLTGCGRIW